MPQLFDNQQEFTEAAIKIFTETKLSDKYDIVTDWEGKVDWYFNIILKPLKNEDSPSTHEHPTDIEFFQTEDGFMYAYITHIPSSWEEPAYIDYEESDKTFDSLQEAINDYIKSN
jgi:hypothetical protein